MRKYILFIVLSCMSFFHAIAQETVTVNNIRYYIDNGEATITMQDEALSGDIAIPESITNKGRSYTVVRATNGAFQNTDITSISLPNSITSLGNNCFQHCKNLIYVKLPDNITSLGDNCFQFCHNLISVKLPDNITSLGDYVFSSCRKLSSIKLPDTLTSLGEYCFSFCDGLTSLLLPNSITTLGPGCFMGCENIETITLPSNITSLPPFCFKNCKELSEITLHEGITSLGMSCFSGCSSLTSIKLPKSINKIDGNDLNNEGCFEDCSNLQEVTCLWDNLDGIDVSNYTFDNIFSEAKLYIPKGTMAMYKAKEPWSNFKYIIEENDVTEDAEKCQTPTIGYSNKELTFTSPTEGANYHYTITDDDIKTEAYSEDGIISLSATYKISVYASAYGYKNSDRATATLYFINAGLENTTGVLEIEEQRGVLISTAGNNISISGLDDNEKVYLYNLQGMSLAEGTACAGTVNLNAGNERDVVIVKIGEQSIKVKLNH